MPFKYDLVALFTVDTNRTDYGVAALDLRTDTQLDFQVDVYNLNPADSLTEVHIHLGTVENRGDILTLLISPQLNPFIELGHGHWRSSGTISGSDVATTTLTNGNQPLYLTIHSALNGSGLLFGRLRE